MANEESAYTRFSSRVVNLNFQVTSSIYSKTLSVETIQNFLYSDFQCMPQLSTAAGLFSPSYRGYVHSTEFEFQYSKEHLWYKRYKQPRAGGPSLSIGRRRGVLSTASLHSTLSTLQIQERGNCCRGTTSTMVPDIGTLFISIFQAIIYQFA